MERAWSFRSLFFVISFILGQVGISEDISADASMAARAAADGARITFAAAVSGSGSSSPPVGSFVSDVALKAFANTVSARQSGREGTAPDKIEDQWTMSKAFRKDLEMHFDGMAENSTVLEVGSYLGYTTRLLSQLFGRVIALDAVPHFLRANREYNGDRGNILYLKFHSLHDDWDIFATNNIHVVVLDASHDFDAVALDIENSLKLPLVSIIIFDDYGAEEGVRQAVQLYAERGLLRPVLFLGEGAADGKPWRVLDGRSIHEPEGIACQVVRDPGVGLKP